MTDRVEQLKAGIDKIALIIKEYKQVKNVEIEIRIGVIESGIFRPGLLSEDFFNKVKMLLDSNPDWKHKQTSTTEEQLNNGIVQVGRIKTKKTKMYNCNFSFENTPYDFRISVSTEDRTTEKMKTGGIVRHKNRHSYTHGDYRFDLTYVIQEDNGLSLKQFEFEIELLNVENETSDVYRAHSALLKMRDIINHIETIPEESVVKVINENYLVNFDGLKVS
jgi:hypothetical protein